MQLELKHLAPYLPYGLKIQGTTHGEIAELSCCTETSVNITTRSFQYGMWADIFEVKPILRPLSDMSKFYLYNDSYKNLFTFNKEEDEWIEQTFSSTDNFEINLRNLPFGVIDDMFKNHFDVFELIPAGLAIDINTL